MNADVQDWKTKHFANEVLQKLIFAEVRILMLPESIFYDFEYENFFGEVFWGTANGIKIE